VGSIPEYLQGNLDALSGEVEVEASGEVVDGGPDEESPQEQDGGWELSGRVLLGDGASVGEGARIDGPTVIGAGASIGAGAIVKGSVLLADAEVPADAMLVGAIAGRRGRLAGT
jgi:NDP-sugar pyrophosphorylase family protein